jgi:major membrane immunogen (membrane-anchored lipoprotein)
MKKVIITFIVFNTFLLTSCQQAQTKVYICTGEYSECYHKTSKCIGLSNCSKEIQKIPKEDAAKLRRPCKICY